MAKVSPAGDKIVYAGRISGSAVACGAGSRCFLEHAADLGGRHRARRGGQRVLAGGSNVTDLPTYPRRPCRRRRNRRMGRRVKASEPGSITLPTSARRALRVCAAHANPGNVASDLTVDAARQRLVVGPPDDRSSRPLRARTSRSTTDPRSRTPYPTPPTDAFVAKLNPQGTAMDLGDLPGAARPMMSRPRLQSTQKAPPYVTGTPSRPPISRSPPVRSRAAISSLR